VSFGVTVDLEGGAEIVGTPRRKRQENEIFNTRMGPWGSDRLLSFRSTMAGKHRASTRH
jgi:hypothetical protein